MLKKILVVFIGVVSQLTWATDAYNPINNQLTINQVVVGNTAYNNVVVTVGSVVSIGGNSSTLTYDTYDESKGQLAIPSVAVSGATYENVVITIANVITIGGQAILMPSGNPTQYLLNSGLYTSTTGNYSNSQSASFSFTTTKPLSGNLSNTDISSVISTINYDDGLFSGTLENSSIVASVGPTVLASTDSSGNISSLQISIVSPQVPHKSGTKINSFQINYFGDNLTLSASNNAVCSSVASSGFCSASSNAQSTALNVSPQRFALNAYPNYSQMFVFSDSDSDTGRRLLLEGIPLAPYWQGRHSNGPVAPEYFASNLGIPESKRTNYAVGGAFTGRGNADNSPLVVKTGMLDQFDTFNEALGTGAADPNALYYIRGGSNDFTNCGNASCTSSQIASFNNNISTLIKNLASKGAKHFYLSGLGDGSGKFRAGFNSQLANDAATLAKSLGLEIHFYDYANFYNKTSVIPNPYGFNFLYPSGCYTGNFTYTTGSICNNVWAYTVWDTQRGHTTSRFARLVANSMSDQLILKK